MPASLRSGRSRLVGAVLALVCVARGALGDGIAAEQSVGSAIVLNVRDFGAIGDGKLHPLSEWIDAGKFRELRTLKAKYPVVETLNCTVDELAFALAKAALPSSGGTIHFPAGHYITGQHPWRIWQDNVRITGDGSDKTVLSTAPTIGDGLSVAPYRHAGWLEGAEREFAFTADSGVLGDDHVTLNIASAANAFKPGELVFIRDGASRFDQDYGEFNEVSSVDVASATVRFQHPLSRDYTLSNLNWAAEVAEDFAMPRKGGAVKVKTAISESHFVPRPKTTVTIGENVFCVDRAVAGSLSLANCGAANAPKGTVISAGSKIAKSRTILKLTRSVRNFRCEKIRIVGHRKALNLSNSYDTAFADCVFLRDLTAGGFTGGVTIDGDGGRFARFDRCSIEAKPAAGMQFARSFGGVTFADCHFIDANVAFTEFNFDCEVVRCTFDVNGSSALTNVIIAGKSCGGLRFIDNRIRATGVASVFDTLTDIQSQKHPGDGGVLVRGNVIETKQVGRVFPLPASTRFAVEDNEVMHD